MKELFQTGDCKEYRKVVTKADIAQFESGTVHQVYSTFALGRDAEWACRLFVLEMKEAEEEGIGTFLNIKHQSPALLGAEVVFTSTYKGIESGEIICDFVARVENRVIAEGSTGQRILKKEKLKTIFEQASHG